jgi:nucleotidyltransferase AbiEii toxin of type IV toxin-antitoxin system
VEGPSGMGEANASGQSLDAGQLLQALTKNGVDFVLVGGLAGLLHGSSYPTFDLDVVYARDRQNISRMAAALRDVEVKLRGAPTDLPFLLDERTIENGSNFTFETAFGPFDILGHADGMPPYEELRTNSKLAAIDGIEVRVASLDDLIAMKRAANRDKDKLMVAEYIEIADEQRRLEEERG